MPTVRITLCGGRSVSFNVSTDEAQQIERAAKRLFRKRQAMTVSLIQLASFNVTVTINKGETPPILSVTDN